MEFEIDGVDKEAASETIKPRTHYEGADFQPMRRKMYVQAE